MPIGVEHHALLFAYLAREACTRCGAAGEAAMLEGVRRYGERRGRRMAESAHAHGYANDYVGLLLFGELDFTATGNASAVEQGLPHVVTVATRCGWCNAWQDGGVLEYGRLYCREIDAAVTRGFNPACRFVAQGTMANGDAVCRFVYPDARLGPQEQERLAAGRALIGSGAIRPFSFHTVELLHVLGCVLTERLAVAGREAAEAALAAFSERFGAEAAATVRAEAARLTDTDRR